VGKVNIYELNESYCTFDSDDRGILTELKEYFSFDVPNARFMPAYKNKMWDGKFYLANINTQRIYKGLIPYIKQFCIDREYDFFDDHPESENINFDIEAFLSTINLPFSPYDFQVAAIKHSIEQGRATLLSPTASGKSLIIYCLIRFFMEKCKGKILVCVPTIGLVTQLTQEFKDYDPTFDIEPHIHHIYQGQEKTSNKKIFLSTWQSVYKLTRKFFEQFDTIICDEAHTMSGESVKGIFEKSATTKYRFGLTGTLNGIEYNRLIIEGLCGPVYETTKTKELIKKHITSDLIVKCTVLKYPQKIREANKNMKYQDEMKFIVNHDPRNRFIAKLAKQIPDKNMLILTAYRDHITLLKAELELVGKTVYVVTGDTPPEERERIRQLAEIENGIVILATFGVYSTGINIKNIQYLVFATGSKSLIRVLQSIGRGLRKDGKLNKLVVFDLIDDFSYISKTGTKYTNTILKHFFERIKIYTDQQFEYKLHNINI